MPGNEVGEWTRNLYELNNLSHGQHLPQAVGNNWELFSYNQLVGKSGNANALPDFSFENYVSAPLGSEKIQGNFINPQLDPYDSPLAPRIEYSRSIPANNPGNVNEFTFHCSNSLSPSNQPEFVGETNSSNQLLLISKGFPIPKPPLDNYCADSPTLTTNSERSEITEASCDFNFLGGNRNTLRNQSLDSSNYCEMQQSGFSEMQLVQQDIMYRQLLEFQRQQQLHQLGDNRQQNSFNQLAKQVSAVQFSSFANGMPVIDSPQMFRSRMQLIEPAVSQGLLHRSIFPQEQKIPASQMNPAPQQLDMSVHGAPISESRSSMPQSPYLQGISHELTKDIGQAQKGTMLSSGFGNLYPAYQSLELGVSQESFFPKQEFPVKGGHNQVHVQGLGSGGFTLNVQENPTQGNDTSLSVFSGREHQDEWQAVPHTTKQVELSQDLVPLDPLEAKILYNTDDSIWDAFGAGPGMIYGGFDNTSEHGVSSNAFTCQSGSWSALMQSAVADVSNSDTGIQEEFSGLTFQNTENSNENQVSSVMESVKQKISWLDNPSQDTSHTPKPFSGVGDTSPSFSGFHQPGNGSSIELSNILNQDMSPQFFDNFDSQKKQSVVGDQKIQMFLHSGNAWPGRMTGLSESDEQNQRVAPNSFPEVDKGNESLGKVQLQINDGHYDRNETVNESYQKQNYHQRDDFVPKGLSGYEQGRLEHFKFFGSNSSSLDVDKSYVPDIQADGRARKDAYDGAGHQLNAGNQSRSTLVEVPEADNVMAIGSQLYMQAATSQKQALNLALPLQKPPNSSKPLSPRSIMDESNSTNVTSKLEERNKMCPVQSSFPLVPHESSREVAWENTTSSEGHSGISYRKAVSPHPNTQIHSMTPMPVASQSVPVISPGCAGRNQTVTPVSSHENFQSLETSTVPHPSNTLCLPHQHNVSRSSHNQWGSNHAQQQSCYAKPVRPSPRFPSWAVPPLRTMKTPSVSLGPTADNSIKGGSESSEFSVPRLQSSEYGEHFGGVSEKQIPSVLPDGFQIDETTKNHGLDSGTTFAFQTAVSHSPFQGPIRSPSNFEIQHAPILGGLQFDDNSSSCRSLDSAPNSAALQNLFAAEETKMLSCKEDARIGLVSPQSSVQAPPSQELVMFGQSTPNPQSSAVKSLFSGDQGPINQLMSPWIKQYETFRNGQTVPLIDSRLPKAAFQQLYPGEPPQVPHKSLERLGTGTSGHGWPSPISTLVGTQHPSPCLQPSDASDQVAIMKPKKRKAVMSDLLPWHKEVMQESKRILSLSTMEKLWARATYRLAEKVQDEIEIIEGMQSVHRSKRRITFTSQLMQLLFLPPPTSVFSSEPTASNCETMTYIVSRLSLGDSCSISCHKESDLLGLASGRIMNMESPSFVSSRDLQRRESLEVLVNRIKSLENDLKRLDKTASVVELRTDLQDLEKFSVINRFAKFHSRSPSEAVGTSSMAGVPPRLLLQRYVTAFPLPRNLPEGEQCLSL